MIQRAMIAIANMKKMKRKANRVGVTTIKVKSKNVEFKKPYLAKSMYNLM